MFRSNLHIYLSKNNFPSISEERNEAMSYTAQIFHFKAKTNHYQEKFHKIFTICGTNKILVSLGKDWSR
jgi:hypothetical protein